LCELRSFTKAAKRCDVWQPALTNAITALEREIGGVLFQRRTSVTLT
jgi:DNA-binding transcriptional LysR family regulator